MLAAPRPTASHGVVAALPFAGITRSLLLALKYRNRREVADVLARVALHRTLPGPVDLVTWSPTSPDRIRRRGFDQSYLLAAAVARELGVPCRRLLFRRQGPSQTGRRRAERMAESHRYRSTSASRRRPQRGLRVLLVDDVVTTGATLLDAQAALVAAGVDEVVALAIAATPAGGPRR